MEGMSLQKHKMLLYVSVVLALMMSSSSLVDHNDGIRGVAAADEEDSWFDRMSQTSSSYDVQPKEYNKKGSFWVHHKHQHHKKTTGRSNLEVSEQLTRGDAFAASTPSSTPNTIVVAKDGSGNFKTVQAAVNSIPKSNKKRVVIQIKAGIYKCVTQ